MAGCEAGLLRPAFAVKELLQEGQAADPANSVTKSCSPSPLLLLHFEGARMPPDLLALLLTLLDKRLSPKWFPPPNRPPVPESIKALK